MRRRRLLLAGAAGSVLPFRFACTEPAGGRALQRHRRSHGARPRRAHPVGERLDQPVICTGSEEYSRFAKQTFEEECRTTDRLALKGAMPAEAALLRRTILPES